MTDPTAAHDVPGWRKRIRAHLSDIERAADLAGEMLPWDLPRLLDDQTLNRLVTRLIADGLPGRVSTPADEVTYEWRVHAPGRGQFTVTDGFHTEEHARRFAANDRAHGVESTLMRREVRRGPWEETHNA